MLRVPQGPPLIPANLACRRPCRPTSPQQHQSPHLGRFRRPPCRFGGLWRCGGCGGARSSVSTNPGIPTPPGPSRGHSPPKMFQLGKFPTRRLPAGDPAPPGFSRRGTGCAGPLCRAAWLLLHGSGPDSPRHQRPPCTGGLSPPFPANLRGIGCPVGSHRFSD